LSDLATKVCAACKAEKPIADFTPRKGFSGRSATASQCRACRNAWYKQHRAEPLEREKARLEAKRCMWGDAGLELFNRLRKEQNDLCALCHKPETRKNAKGDMVCDLVIDHDHSTGKIRGLLCSACNTFLGRLEKRLDLLPAIFRYLKRGEL
jgi:hypothetical protein